jgi:3-hydroxybutyrate dehydrogenase
LIREVALEAAPFGVTVNAICPGAVLTDMVRDSIRMMARDLQKSEEEIEEVWKGRNPQKRLLDPEEVVPQALLLISDDAPGITGQAINVNGGSMMV